MNPISLLLGWLGGRTFQEMRAHGSAGYQNAIIIGTFTLIGIPIICAGQYLFIKGLPGWADAALWVAMGMSVVYTAFYRTLMRSTEVMGYFARGVCFVMGTAMVGTNAMLAGHELVILAFAPQVAEMGALSAAAGTQALRDQTSGALGLSQLRADDARFSGAAGKLRDDLALVPEAVTALRNKTVSCDASARNLRSNIPAADAAGYSAARERWHTELMRCGNLRSQAAQALAAYRAPLEADLAAMQQRARSNGEALSSANAKQASTLAQNANTIEAANTTGFARHRALWAAVQADKVPAWAALGLMAVALLLEGAGLIIKLLLPPDSAAYTRNISAQEVSFDAELDLQYVYQLRKYVKPTMREYAAQHADNELRDLHNRVLAPGLHTRLAANAFAKAHQRVTAMQKATGQAAIDVAASLADVAAGVASAGNIKAHSSRPT